MTRTAPSRLEQRALAFIRRHALLRAGDTIICALSGGADSVALLRFLHRHRQALGVDLEVAHVHHEIEEALSDEAATVVARTASRLGLRHHQVRVDVPALARRAGCGLEAAGREIRLQWFARLASSRPRVRVATAHTAEDQAETVLLRMLRGTGAAGIAGIRPSLALAPPPSSGTLIRPFLEVRRADARAYALAEPWELCEDPTNRDPHFPRNRTRHLLLPFLASEFNPSVVEALCRLATAAADDQALLAQQADAAWTQLVRQEGATLLLPTEIREQPAPLRIRILARALQECGAPVESTVLGRLEDLLRGHRRRRLVASRVDAERTPEGIRMRLVPPGTPSLSALATEVLDQVQADDQIAAAPQEEPAPPGGNAP